MSVEGVDFGSLALASAARDLTAPLVLLRQLSFQLDVQLSDNLSPEAKQTLDRMRVAIGRSFEISDQLKLALGSADNLALEPIQLNGLCVELKGETRALAKETNCLVDFELPRRQQVVAIGNYDALKTTLLGFLTDSLYCYPDKTKLTNDRIIRLRVGNKNGQVSIAVSDGAGGINLTKALQMISNQNSVNPTGSRPLMGSLNLLLANRLVEAMNGKLAVHNHRGGGMTIETLLPISRQMSLWGVL